MMTKEFYAENLCVRAYDTRSAMGCAAATATAEAMRQLFREKARISMIFAAAPSQNEFLTALAMQPIDWERVDAFHMDEYIGLDAAAPQLFSNYLKNMLFDRLSFASVNLINGAASQEAECARYSALLRERPADIVCMGIGENGHIAFNDPSVADFEESTLVKVVDLEPRCRQQQVNDGCFAALSEVPTHAITLTIPALFKAPIITCVAPGPTKAETVRRTLYDEVSTDCPATVLRRHAGATLYLDCDSVAKA